MSKTTKTIGLPKVHIYGYDDWSAVYVDGELVHWHTTPSLVVMCRILGVEAHSCDMPEFLYEPYKYGGKWYGSRWSPPQMLAEMERLIDKDSQEKLEEEISQAERKVVELKAKRKQR